MNADRRQWIARYGVALRRQVERNGPANQAGAKALGRAALALGFTTLDLAVIHEKTLVGLPALSDRSGTRSVALKRSGAFFTQAIIPLETSQHQDLATRELLRQSNAALRTLTAGLHERNVRLKREVNRRKADERAILRAKEKYRALFRKSQVMQMRLRQLTHQIIMAQEEERREVSRELHDEVVQTLVGINVELAALGRAGPLGLDALKAKIAQTKRLVEHSVDVVHAFARELRPVVLDELGLIPALHVYSKQLAERKKLNIQMTVFGGVEALGADKRTVLFRVAQEALTNVARHAQASVVRLSITEIAGTIRLEVSDNGRSFNVEKTLSTSNPKRLGLTGMKERVEMVGGRLSIESGPTSGTVVRAEIPIGARKLRPEVSPSGSAAVAGRNGQAERPPLSGILGVNPRMAAPGRRDRIAESARA